MDNFLEEGARLQLDFQKLAKISVAGESVAPGVVQDVETGTVLLLAYVNELALQEMLRRGVAVFWSTSRNELWIKGATSGDVLELDSVYVNCEQNSLLIWVRLRGNGACHTKNPSGESRLSCYYRRLDSDGHLGPVTDFHPWLTSSVK